MELLKIHMLGEFSLSWGNQTICDNSRSRKVWGLLAYLLCNYRRFVPSATLLSLLWGDESDSSNPESALRTTVHRLRSLLDALWPGAGLELICYREGAYGWNPQVPIVLDCERMEALTEEPDPDRRLEHLLEALELYQGPFLPKLSDENWVIPLSAHFQNLFLKMTLEASDLLLAQKRSEEVIPLCHRAITLEPYQEALCQKLMLAFSQTGNPIAAAEVYNQLSKRLFDDFGVRPSEETRAVYRATSFSPENRTVNIDEVLEHLHEPGNCPGALVCDYDYFKMLCYSESRSMERTGSASHVALFSLAADENRSKRGQERILEQFGEQLRLNLRRGDTISRCSVTQYIILLPKANYENSCMVCLRILAAFRRTHPGVHATFHYMVQPLSPSICVP